MPKNVRTASPSRVAIRCTTAAAFNMYTHGKRLAPFSTVRSKFLLAIEVSN